MSVATMYAALRANLTGEPPNQQIDLYTASGVPELAPLRDALARLGITASYRLTGVRLVQDVGSVALTGGGTFAVPGAPPEFRTNVVARLTGTAPGGADQFELALAVTGTGWTFGRTFPTLPLSQQLQGQVAPYTTSFLAAMRVDSPTFTARSVPGSAVRLSGLLPQPDVLPEQAKNLLAPWPLRLDGTVTMPSAATEPPELDLLAIATGVGLRLGPVDVADVGLEILAVRGFDDDEDGLTAYSILNLAGSFTIGRAGAIRGRVTTPILLAGGSWHFLAEFEEDTNSLLPTGVAPIDALFGVSLSQYLPAGFVDLAGFYVSTIEVVVSPVTADGGVPALEQISVTLTSRKTWNPPIPFVRLTNVATRWVVGWTPVDGKQTHYIAGSVGGTLIIGDDPPPEIAGPEPGPVTDPTGVAIGIEALIPGFVITGHLQDGSWIPLGTGFRAYFGDPGPTPAQPLAITQLSVLADPLAQTYAAEGVIAPVPANPGDEIDPARDVPAIWTIQLGANVFVNLTSLMFQIDVTQGAVTGGVTGQFVLEGGAPAGMPDPRIVVSAEYTGSDSPDGWVFGGELYQDSYLELFSLVANFLGITPPSGLPVLAIERLSLRFATGTQAYSLAGTVAARWTPTLFDGSRSFSATASIEVRKDADAAVQGILRGRFAIDKVAVTVGMDLGVTEPTYLFMVEIGDAWISAVTGWRGETPRHQVLSLQLGGVTLGSMLEYLVNLAAPALGFRLEPPWDVLNRIDLSRFVLTIDPTQGTVELVYTVNADLFVMYVEQVGVIYTRKDGRGAVDLTLTGRLLDRAYSLGKPLKWDVISDPPPALPGQGPSLIDLRYLGVGQHVTLRGDLPTTIRETIDRLRAAMREPADPTVNPLSQPTGAGMQFAAESEWLIGLDLSVLEAVDLAFVFNDPRLYGLSVALGGEKVGSLAGLRFEILYKKISDTVGMFRVELRLPEAFRQIELGAVSITLGELTVEVYTNGDFLIDLGFPHNRDYERAFTVQVFPFIGRGGIYFGLLDGTTSRRVPAITNGTFAPVLELGVGLAVGVGKEVSVGPVSGGIFVEIEVIFQGVLGWFNPAGSGTAPAKYYWGQGIAAIHGKLYGQADFEVLKVGVTIEAYAQASVVFEAYRETVFRLAVGVKVEANAEVFGFIDVSFTFEDELDVSFTIGSARPTPWILASGQGRTTQERLRHNVLPALTRDPARRSALLRADHLRRAGASEGYALKWDPTLTVFPATPKPVPLIMVPAFSVDKVPVDWTGRQPDNPNPLYQAAFLTFAPNGVTPRAKSVADTLTRSAALSAHATDTTELSSDLLIEALLRWSLSAVTGTTGGTGATITAGQLSLLTEQIAWADTTSEGFSWDNLNTFFGTNLTLRISGDPGGTPDLRGGMVIPVPPALSWSSPQVPGLDFATHNTVGPLYEYGIDRYRDQFFPLAGPPGAVPPDVVSEYESFATYLFRDWCVMVARAAVRAANDQMSGWVYTADGPTSLAEVAAAFPKVSVAYVVRSGDTVDSVAAALGSTPDELLYLNKDLKQTLAEAAAGATITVTLGVSPEAVALDNADVTLAPSATLTLGTIDHQVAAADTLAGIATTFGLSGAAALFSGTLLAQDRALLRTGAVFPVPAITYTPPTGFTTTLTAAAFYVRYSGRTEFPSSDWYAATVFRFNADNKLKNVDYDQPIPSGTTLLVPPAVDNTDPANAVTYLTLPGDTVERIGAALTLAQNFATGSGPDAGWPGYRDAARAVGGAVALPATTVTIQSGETAALLATRTIVQDGNLAGLVGWIATAAVLSPLAVVTVPAVRASTRSGDTLTTIANRYGLTVADLARRVESQDIFAAPVSLTLRHLAVQGIDTLVAAVLAGPAPARISGMSSRLMLSGLRLPGPVTGTGGQVTATGPLTGLYDLTGQQFDAPVPDTARPSEVALEVTFEVDPGFAWIQLMGSTTIAESETLEALAARVPRVRELNPALAQDRLRAGIIVHSGPVTSLVFSYTNAQLSEDYPSTGLAVDPAAGPSPLPLAGKTPRTYGLDHHVELQAPVTLPIPAPGPAPLSGNPSLWPLPAALLTQARSASATPYDLVRISNRADGPQSDEVLKNTTFGTKLSFGIRRLDAADHVYELRGVDAGDRATLLALRTYLAKADTPPGTVAYLLAEPAPDAGNASGVAVLATDPARTFLVKTNQSTETAPPTPLAVSESSQYHAGFGDLAQFSLLLWEGSVVGGSGFYFSFSTATGDDLPASVFDQNGNATLSLLTIAGAQQAAAPDGRTLLPFDNCALVGPGLDASAHALFVEAADDSELISQALVPPGNVGFTLTLPRPTASTPEALFQQWFSLATYHVAATGGSPFTASQPGLPVGPLAEDGQQLPLWQRHRQTRWRRAGREFPAAPLTNDFWRYDQVIPIARFGPPSVAPAVPGLPDPALDPYRGISGQGTLPNTQVQLGFADILGNVTAPPPSGDAGTLTLDVGYTDTLIGPGSWPAATSSFAVSKAADGVTLSITIAPQAGGLMPGPDQAPGATLDAARRQAGRYSTAYFQLAQPGVSASVVTSLRQRTDGGPDPVATTLAPLRTFTAAGYLAAQASASLLPVTPFASASGRLQTVARTYGVGYAELAAANANARVADLFGTQRVTVPAFVVFGAGDSAATLTSRLPDGWPKPAGAALLAFPQNANVLPLRPGIVLTIPAATVPATSRPLAEIAATHHTTPALLATDNTSATGILADGFVFTMDGLTVTVGVTLVPETTRTVSTFADVATAFAGAGVRAAVADVAAENATTGGMLVPGATLATLHYVAGRDETLAANESGATVAQLAAANTGTVDVFDAGALVYLGPFSPSPSITAGSGETLAEFADRYACPPGQLLAANPALTLPSGSPLVVPGTLTMPTGVSVPYTILRGDALGAVAAKFAPGTGSPALALATVNLVMPGTIAPGRTVSVTIGTTTYQTPTQTGDSFASVLGRLSAQSPEIHLANLVEAIEDSAGYLAVGGLLVCPPASLPAPTAGATKLTPDDLVDAYGLDASAVAQANAALLGLIAAGVNVHNGDQSVTIGTLANDTFNSVVARFAAAGAQVSIPEIVSANHGTAFLRVGGPALLPPAPVEVSAGLGEGAGPFLAPAFPLTVALRVARPEAVVDPAFRTAAHDGPVERADSTIPVPLHPEGTGGQEALTLKAFAEAFRLALPDLRLATGNVDGVTADLWVVDFGTRGIAGVTVAPGVTWPDGKAHPRFFALKPLYNELVSRPGVPIRALRPDGGLSPGTTPTNFFGVDVEVWARRLLADVDLFLTAPYATAVYQNAGARAALDQVSAAKAKLVSAIPSGLASVFDVGDPLLANGLAEAARRLGQEVAVNLSRAYDTAAVVQYDAAVTSAWTATGSTLAPARLSGGTSAKLAANRPYSLTSAKTDLTKSASFVTFLMSVADPARHSAIPVDLTYNLHDLEMNIRPVAGIGGYEASDWLTFVPPLDGVAVPADVHTDLGQATVPIPLRAYPALPTLLGQTANATYTTALNPTLAQSACWTYGLTYSHEHAEQDEVVITTTYNVPPPPEAAPEDQNDVASTLAKYIAVADGLWALLAGFATPGGDPGVLANAAATFGQLAVDVATAWETHWTPITAQPLAAPGQSSYRFVSRVFDRTGADNVAYLDTLHLTSGQATPGPIDQWPEAFCQAPDGTLVRLVPGQPSGRELIYQFPAGARVPAVEWPRITLEWAGLTVTGQQNARASLAVHRNRQLVEGGPATADPFVYRTATVQAPEAITPLNTWRQRFDITGLGTSVAPALNTAFQALFGTATGLPITAGILYGFELVPPAGDGEGLVTYLPVSLYPNQQLGSGTATAIAAALAAWQTANQPASRGGEWVFSLVLYSQLDPAARRPLLSLDRLVYRLTSASGGNQT